ncbi:MAG: amino acid ABC transporter ATP-binding protein [Lentisphaeria bacterium]|nr:amino acid ABC transporter ATP-binding protein [Lentisphaeria bacterium]
MNDVVTISHLSKSFGDMMVLKDISLSVKPGEVVSIIGPSGSGKSTLLRCATMLEKADSGDLRYGDIPVMENGVYFPKSNLMSARNRFGLVFQNFNLFPHYSVLKNIIDAPVCVQKRKKKEVIAEAMELLRKMGLEDRADAYPCQLSGGQQQRVSIVRALAMKPEILFFDEPTSALDPELTGEILKVIRHLAEEYMTMVIVTHEINFAKNVSDRIVFMADGVIVEEGPAADLVDNPKNERTKAFLANISKDRD